MSRADVRFSDLESSDEFVRRHIGSGTSEQRDMLGVLNFTSLDEVVDSVIPASIRPETQLDIGAIEKQRRIAGQSSAATNIGLRCRIDNAYGDKNLVCTCPPVDSYQ